MRILKCCVIDDEPIAARLINDYIERTPFTESAGVFCSAQDAIKVVLSGNIDVVFLDIQMPQLNGLEFARLIPKDCKIVFTTAYDRYAIDGFKVNAVDYLLKPISYTEFLAAATKVLNMLEAPTTTQNDYIIVKSEYKLVQIPIKEIVFVEGVRDYVKIYLEGDSTVLTLMSIKSLEQSLPKNIFMRVHRSYIVNTSKIRVIERNRILFGKHFVPISESYKQDFADYVAQHSVSASRE
ncbi:MAG: LytTR family DNA-binding domain-containing protein [Paramuribaculum sp.]|nr:LytTR family DNA-binding domain-containing protein [Paramuribaculum sp.]